jgi:hypothetical protein
VAAPSLEEAHIVVRSDGDEIVIEPRTSTVLAGQPKPRFALGDPAHLPQAIDGVMHFSYFLDCANEADRVEGVELEMHRLRGEYPCCTPDLEVGDMIKDGEVRLTSEVGSVYGFTIRNTSDKDLFPYLFYFDPETYTIQVSGILYIWAARIDSCLLRTGIRPQPRASSRRSGAWEW